MRTVQFVKDVRIPDGHEFAAKYNKYTTLQNSQLGNDIYAAMTESDSVIAMMIASNLKLTAVDAIAEKVSQVVKRHGKDLKKEASVKQFIGALACSIMEANGYTIDRQQQNVKHPNFTVAKTYRIK